MILNSWHSISSSVRRRFIG